MVVKYFSVPSCGNNSLKNTNKLFIRISTPNDVKEQWHRAINPTKVLKGVHGHVCEDHFNLEEDAENWNEYKLLGTRLRMKKNAVPHLNLIANETDITKSQLTSSAKKRKKENQLALSSKRKLNFDNEEHEEACSSVGIQIKEYGSPSGKFYVCVPQEKLQPSKATDELTKNKSVAIQFSVQTGNKSTQTKFPRPSTSKTIQLSDTDEISTSSSSPTKNDPTDPTFLPLSSSTDMSPVKQDALKYKVNNEFLSIKNIENHSRLYLGLPGKEYFMLKMITAEVQVNYKDILICIKKIRLNDSYKRMSIEFGSSTSSVSRAITKALPKLAFFFNDFIYWPNPNLIKMKLPVQFSIRYREVQSVIDCLEIEIQTPSNALNQAQTWSSYKKCNTIKYLVSATPHGFVNFISEGYGGRTTDVFIVENSDYLNVVPENCHVMSDRGFKNIASVLMKKKCKLVRPPSTVGGNKMSKEEVTESKRIAALRIHIERVIGRLREFELLSPHACVNSQLIPVLDHIIVIACGIINVQGLLIK